MRLLRRKSDEDFELVTFNTDDLPPYAILSHTWTEGQEVTYDELLAGTGKGKAGYVKIRFCGERAAQDGLLYFWVDTCCINKSTSEELSTAINSMFRWYQRATKCYVYLSDVQAPAEVVNVQSFRITWEDAFRRSRWFTRGWTLQELIAPPMVEFFCKEGKRLGSKISLEREIQEITKVPFEALRGQRLSDFSVSERMSWAVNRNTTLKEDKVYCLFGIFEVFMPLIYGEGESHASQRLEEEIQRRIRRKEGRDKERLRDLPASSLLPFPRNEFFVGRENQLQSLETLLFSPNSYRRITIFGLGGCGKSALALEFAYRAIARHAKYLVLWVPAFSRESFELAYRDIGILLRVPGITDDNADVKQLVKKELSSDSLGDWLMIVDNADDASVLLSGSDDDPRLSQLSDYLPRSDRGSIIFTTRSRKTAENLTPSNVIKLDDMDRTEARGLMAQRLSEKVLLEDEKAVDELLGLLAYLPLAIVQATAFINSNGVSISEYISLFRQPSMELQLFSEHFEDSSRYREMESTIAKTWHISFNQILKQDRLAADYLSFMASIDRINIPQSLLPSGDSPLQQAKAIGTLKGYAFITERRKVSQQLQGEKFFDIHRLVHMASIWWLKEQGEWNAWIGRAVSQLDELIPYGGHETREGWATYLPHAIHVAAIYSTLNEIASASLLHRVGRCQASLGQYTIAETTYRQVFFLREKVFGKEYPDTLASMNSLAGVLDSQGKYEAAEAIYRQTFEVCTKVVGIDHPLTLTSTNKLARVLHIQGKYEAAEEIYRQTLAAREQLTGKEHLDTLISMNSLADLPDSEGNYKVVEAMHREALAEWERLLGKDHPDTLMSMCNLAAVLDSQGKYKAAEAVHRQTITRWETVLGKDHPSTLTSMNNLAVVLDRQGKYKEAEAMLKQTLAAREKMLGEEHPDTLTSMSNLAGVLDRLGKYEEAEAMHRQILAARGKILGEKHPDTLTSMYCLADLLANQHRYDESAALYERACAEYSAVLGNDHPITLACREGYSEMLVSQEQDLPTLPLGMPQRQDGGNARRTTNEGLDVQTGKVLKLRRGLLKIGIRGSKVYE